MNRVLSGIKPTGNLTLGNYLGALKNFPKYQDADDLFIFIADLHALTLPIDPQILRAHTKQIAATYLACGLDPNKCTLFLQSQVSAHAELNVILQNYLYMGELSRMTQFKDKSSKCNESAIGLGLFAYPVLMASDILLYDATTVPVGQDQNQHVEITRDLVNRFNKRYGQDVLIMPKAVQPKIGKKIMSLQNPTQKMGKSESHDVKGTIFLNDDPAVIRKKIMSAVTDMDDKIVFDDINKPGISNLLTIYCALKECSIEDAQIRFSEMRYGDFKKEVADVVVAEISFLQQKIQTILKTDEIDRVLAQGKNKAELVANKTLRRVKEVVGLINE